MISLIGPDPRFRRMPVPNFKFHRWAFSGSSRRRRARTVLLKAITVDFHRHTREDACVKARFSCRSCVWRATRDLTVRVAVMRRYALQCCIATACRCPVLHKSTQIWSESTFDAAQNL